MARPKPWIGSIPNILKAVKESDQSEYRRADVQELFQIGKSAALELMNVVGSKLSTETTEGALVVSKGALVSYLTHGPEAQLAAVELARKAKLAAKLNEAARQQKARAFAIPGVDRDQNYFLKDLANVSISPGLLTVVFQDGSDLAAQLYKLAQAICAEPDLFMEVCAEKKEKAS